MGPLSFLPPKTCLLPRRVCGIDIRISYFRSCSSKAIRNLLAHFCSRTLRIRFASAMFRAQAETVAPYDRRIESSGFQASGPSFKNLEPAQLLDLRSTVRFAVYPGQIDALQPPLFATFRPFVLRIAPRIQSFGSCLRSFRITVSGALGQRSNRISSSGFISKSGIGSNRRPSPSPLGTFR